MTDINDKSGILVQGHIKIFDPESNEILIDKRNAIHYENMSIALAESLANSGQGFISEMSFGNGGTSVDPTGIITYLTPNTTGTNASLYRQTFSKIVDDRNANNTDPARNKLEIRHVSGTNYTDVFVSCLLDYGEPNGQDAFDTANSEDSPYVFDELGHFADVRFDGAEGEVCGLCRCRFGQRVKQGRFADVRQTHDTHLESHRTLLKLLEWLLGCKALRRKRRWGHCPQTPRIFKAQRQYGGFYLRARAVRSQCPSLYPRVTSRIIIKIRPKRRPVVARF